MFLVEGLSTLTLSCFTDSLASLCISKALPLNLHSPLQSVLIIQLQDLHLALP